MENERGQGKGRVAKDGSKWRVPAGLVQREGVVGWVHGQRGAGRGGGRSARAAPVVNEGAARASAACVSMLPAALASSTCRARILPEGELSRVPTAER